MSPQVGIVPKKVEAFTGGSKRSSFRMQRYVGHLEGTGFFHETLLGVLFLPSKAVSRRCFSWWRNCCFLPSCPVVFYLLQIVPCWTGSPQLCLAFRDLLAAPLFEDSTFFFLGIPTSFL